MRHGTNGFTSLPKEGVLRIFLALKNPTASAGFEPANLSTKDQHATSRPPKPLIRPILRFGPLLVADIRKPHAHKETGYSLDGNDTAGTEMLAELKSCVPALQRAPQKELQRPRDSSISVLVFTRDFIQRSDKNWTPPLLERAVEVTIDPGLQNNLMN